MSGRLAVLAMVLIILVLLAACAAGPNTERGIPNAVGDVAGFWQGLWHGIIAPVAFVFSLFDEGVAIYDAHNNGHWYDFGFILGACVLGGGIFGSKRSRG